jgi:hypothetical protein
MTAQIITFAPAQRRIVPIAAGEHSAPEPSPRDARRDRKAEWSRAELAWKFLERQHDFVTWCEIAQGRGVAEALQLKPLTDDDRMASADKLHEATRVLLLTPAPDKAALNWKRCRLARGGLFALGNASPDAVKRSIAEDEAYLAAHPARSGRQRGA